MTVFRVIAAACAVVALVMGAGCTARTETPQLQYSTALDEAIMQVAGGGEPVPLSSVVDGSWDAVARFHDGARIADIEALVGETGLKGDRYVSSTDLLVFLEDGSVVALVQSGVDRWVGDEGRLVGADAAIAPDETRAAAGGGYVTLAGTPSTG